MALTDNIAAYWKLDESSGNASDSTGAGKTLINNNSVAYNTAKINNGANFGTSNTNKSLFIGDNLGIAGGNITVSMWVKMNTEIGSGEGYLFKQECVDSSSRVGYSLAYQYNGGTRRLSFSRERRGVGTQSLTYNITLGTSNFYHIVFTYNGTNIEGYVNGSSVGTAAASGDGSSGTTYNGFVLAATYSDNIIQIFSSSTIDEVGVWTRAISSTEVTDLYNGGSGIQYPFSTALSIDVNDSLSIAESVIINEVSFVNTSDQVSISDVPSLNQVSSISVSDDLSISDVPSLNQVSSISVSDDLSISELLMISQGIFIFDDVDISENISISISDPEINIYDEQIVTDVVSVDVPYVLSVYDDVPTDDFPQLELLIDNLSVYDDQGIDEDISTGIVNGISVYSESSISEDVSFDSIRFSPSITRPVGEMTVI